MSTSLPTSSDRDGSAAPAASLAHGRHWIAIAGGWMLYTLVRIALLQFAPRNGLPWSWASTAALAFSVGLFWTLATPLVFALAARLRPDRVGIARSVGIHALAAVLAAIGASVVRQITMHLLAPEEPNEFLLPFLGMLDFYLITYAMLAVIGTALDRYREYAASLTRSLALLTQLSEARLQFLQRQLQPHFLFNALNTVAELARESPVMARRTLLDLARLLHTAMRHANDPEVTLREELSTLAPFLQIQRLRFSDSLDIELDVSPETLCAYVPPMLLQPLIENAIRHGHAGRGERGTVRVVARRAGARLVLRVENDGSNAGGGSVSSVLPSRNGHGIGLRNTTERLAQLYGQDHKFSLRLDNDTTIAELDLPYRDAPSHPRSPVPLAAPETHRRRADQPGDQFVAIVPLSDGTAAVEGVVVPEAVTDTETASPPALSGRAWALILAGWAMAAAYWMLQFYAMMRIGMHMPVLFSDGIIELVSATIWATLTPIVLWLARAIRIHRGRLGQTFAFHVAAATVMAVVHVSVTYSVGVQDRPLLHVGSVNPFLLDYYIYFALLAWSHSRDFTAWYQARGVYAARTEAAIARARVDASALALHTPFLLHVLESAAALALVSAARTERVVERLADLLRGLLQTAGNGVHTVLDELILLERFLEVHQELSGVQTEVYVSIDAQALAACMPRGVGSAVIDDILDRARAAPDARLLVAVEPAGPGHAREITFRVSRPESAGAAQSTAGQTG